MKIFVRCCGRSKVVESKRDANKFVKLTLEESRRNRLLKKYRDVAPKIVAEYLSGKSVPECGRSFRINRNTTAEIVRDGTTPEQRKKIRRQILTRRCREHLHRKHGIEFKLPEWSKMRDGDNSIWARLVRMSRRFVLAGFEIDEARMLATGVVEEEGAGI